MIKRLIVKKLHGKYDYDLHFHEDVNILTGVNGAGKTTVMKLMWYLVGGNIKKIFEEKMRFEYLELQLNSNTISVRMENEAIIFNGNSINIKDVKDFEIDFFDSPLLFEKKPHSFYFFPTFRRIEGGFGVNEHEKLRESLKEICQQVENPSHIFNTTSSLIFAISTQDIIQLLTEKYTEISEKVNAIRNKQAEYVLEKTRENVTLDPNLLKEIHSRVQADEVQKEALFRPFTVLSDTIKALFLDKGVNITESLILGQTKQSLISDKLSSGEKQMLSFLAYNAFCKNTTFFIDEPEISLHIDWQRMLVPTLLAQKSGNQLFLATHSPFIYTKFPHKEVELIPNSLREEAVE